MKFCPSCDAEITETDIKAGQCTQCGQGLEPVPLDQMFNAIAKNAACMKIIKDRLEKKR